MPGNSGGGNALDARHTDPKTHLCLGVRPCDDGWRIRVLAPHADSVSLTGDFNAWSPDAHPLRPCGEGIFEGFLPAESARAGEKYKFFLRRGREGFYKADPWATAAACPPETASLLPERSAYPWKDALWLSERARTAADGAAPTPPFHLYDLDPLTWASGEGEQPLTYPVLARELSSYVKQLGFTHVALRSVGATLGTDPSADAIHAPFAPSARQGDPSAFRALVDGLHEAGIGVLVHWSTATLSADPSGLSRFDGAPLFEESDCGQEQAATRFFAFDRPAVSAFLLAAAHHWVEEYHLDGILVDRTETLLSRPGGRELLMRLRRSLTERFPGVLTLTDLSSDPRREGENDLDTLRAPTFPTDAPARDRLALWRLRLTDGASQPGKRALPMGAELGAPATAGEGVAWSLLAQESHARLQLFVATLNHLYLTSRPLCEAERCVDRRIPAEGSADCTSVRALLRRHPDGSEWILLFNPTATAQQALSLSLPREGEYRELLNTDARCFGGGGLVNAAPLVTRPLGPTGKHLLLLPHLAPYAAALLCRV